MNSHQRRRTGLLRVVVSGALLVSIFAGIGIWVGSIVPVGTLVSLVKYATLLLGAVWAFSLIVYNNLSDLTNLPGIDYRQHRGLESAIKLRLQWFWYRAMILGVVGLTANLPMFLQEGNITPKPWAFAVAFGALALAMFLLRHVWVELEDIRELRSEVKELERMEHERAEQVRSLKEGERTWEPDARLVGHGPGGDESAPGDGE